MPVEGGEHALNHGLGLLRWARRVGVAGGGTVRHPDPTDLAAVHFVNGDAVERADIRTSGCMTVSDHELDLHNTVHDPGLQRRRAFDLGSRTAERRGEKEWVSS